MTTGYLLIDLLGTAITAEELEMLAHPAVAGLILFAKNFESSKQLKDLTKAIHKKKPSAMILLQQKKHKCL